MRVRVRNFDARGISIGVAGAVTKDDADAFGAVLDSIRCAYPQLFDRARAFPWVDGEASIYLDTDRPIDRVQIKARIKAMFRSAGFDVVPESVPIGRQVR